MEENLEKHTAISNNNDVFFGKSYIISDKHNVSIETMSTSIACGFKPLTVKKEAIECTHCLEKLYNICLSPMSSIIPFNISRLRLSSYEDLFMICSHRKALDMISNDNYTSDSDWSLILEDEVTLNPYFNSTDFQKWRLKSIISKAMELDSKSNTGFIYFGSCFPKENLEQCKDMGNGVKRCVSSVGKRCNSNQGRYIGVSCRCRLF